MKDIIGTARVVAKPLPFKDDVLQTTVVAGMSLREILGSPSNNYIINLNGETISYEDWELTFVNSDDLVLIYKIPTGDGRDVLRLFAAIAVLAFSYWAAPWLASSIGLSEAFWTSALMFGGMIAIGLLLPPEFDAQGERESKRLYSATGSRNQFLPFGTIPNVYGKHRLYPPIASVPYTEVIGEDQYLNMIFCIGLGDYTIDATQIKIGETLATNYSDIDINITDQPDQQDIFELQQSLTLNQDTDNPGDTFTRATAADTEEISLDFVLSAGLIQIDPDDGDEHYVRLHFSVEYRPTSGGTWTFVTGSDIGGTTRGRRIVIAEQAFDYPPPDTSSYGSVSVSSANANWLMVRARTRDPFRMGFKFATGSANTWDVRVTRQRTQLDTRGFFDSTDNVWDEFAARLSWTALRSFKPVPAIALPANTALFLTLRVRATDQLNGIIDSLNLIAERKLRKWNGATFDAPVVTRDPAWAYLDILTGPGNARPIESGDEANKIILDDLVTWATANATEGFFYDEVIDYSTSVFDALTRVCGVGRAALSNRDGKWTVILEEAGGSPVQYFTPRNSWNFSSTKRFVEFPHAFKTRFVSEDADYQEAEQIVYDDGYNSGNATKFEVLELAGITDADQAWKVTRYTMAAIRLRPEVYTFYADVEHVVAQRGDHVLVAHDIPLWGTVYGRITDISGNVVTLDNDATLNGGTTYRMRVRKNDGTSAIETLTLQGGTHIFSHTFTPSIPTGLNVGDLAMLGEVGVETAELVVVGIEPQSDLAAKITCVDHNDGILTADDGAIPAWDPGITLPPDPKTISPAPPYTVYANSDPTTYTVDGSGVLVPRITITWDLVAGAAERWNALNSELRWREYDATSADLGTWNYLAAFNAFQAAISIENVTIGSAYEIEMRTVSPFNITSPWSTAILHTVGGDTRSAAVPTSLTAASIIGAVYTSWTSPISSIFNTIEIWASDDNVRGNAVKIGTTTNDNYIEAIPDLERRTRYYWVRAIDSLNRTSAWEPDTTTTTASAQPRDPDANWVADPEFDLLDTSPDNEFWDEFEAQGTSPTQTGSISISIGTGVDGSNAMDIINSLGTNSFFSLTAQKAQILKNKNAVFQFSIRYKTVGSADALDHTGFTVRINHKYVDDATIYNGSSVPVSLARSTVWTDAEFTHKILFPTASKTLEWARFGIQIESTTGTLDTLRVDSLQVLHIGSMFGDVDGGTTKLSGLVPQAVTAESTKYLKGDGTWDDPPGGSASDSFVTHTVTDTDSGFTWASTGSAVAETATDTLTWVSGNNIDIDVDATSDAIRITATATGTVDISGTPVNNQIAIWTDADTIEGDTNFTWDGVNQHLFANVDRFRVRDNAGTTDLFVVDEDAGDSGTPIVQNFGAVSINQGLAANSVLYIQEMATPLIDFAAYGQLWVKNDVPNNLYFTDDTGQNIQITNDGVLASTVDISGTPVNNQIAIWTDSNTIEGDANLNWDGSKLVVSGGAGTAHDKLHLRDTTDNVDVVFRYNGTNFEVWSEIGGIGDHYFDFLIGGDVEFTNQVVASTISSVSVTPRYELTATSAALNEKNWRLSASTSGNIYLESINDAETLVDTAFGISKTTTSHIIDNMEMFVRLVTDASTASRAGVNIPTGTAPGSPAQGDIWVTATDIFARINGVNESLLSGGGGVDVSAITSTDTTAYPVLVGNAATGSQSVFIDNVDLSYNAATGALSATSFVGALTGNASTASTATNVTLADESADTSCFPLFATDATGNLPPKTNTSLRFNSSTGVFYVGDSTDNLAFSASAAEGLIQHSTGHVRLTPASAHMVYVYRSGQDTQFRVYDSAGTVFTYLYHDTTNGYLATSSGDLYLEAGGGDIFLQDTTHFQDSVNLTFGSSNDFRMYHDGSNTYLDNQATGGSLFIRLNATEIAFKGTLNAQSIMYYNGSAKFETQLNSSLGISSGAKVLDHAGSYQDVGFNLLPKFGFNTSDTLEARHCGKVTGKDNTTSYTLTGPDGTLTADVDDFPVEGVCTVMNLGASVNYTIADTAGCTMYYCDGSAAPVDIFGTSTLSPGGVVTLYRYSLSAIYIFGSGFTP